MTRDGEKPPSSQCCCSDPQNLTQETSLTSAANCWQPQASRGPLGPETALLSCPQLSDGSCVKGKAPPCRGSPEQGRLRTSRSRPGAGSVPACDCKSQALRRLPSLPQPSTALGCRPCVPHLRPAARRCQRLPASASLACTRVPRFPPGARCPGCQLSLCSTGLLGSWLWAFHSFE